MARGSRKRRGVAWELVGIVAILGVFLVGGLFWVFSSGGSEELQEPVYRALDEAEGLEVGVTEDGRTYMGAADAPVTIYEFGDFQCPHCREFSRTGAADMKRELIVTGRARWEWVNFPILGDESTQAAKGATCATEQGQFWAFHDWLFANQPFRTNSGAFSSERLVDLAGHVPDLDLAVFEDCLKSSATAEKVQRDMQFGDENSVEQTPSFLIGDAVVVGGAIQDLKEAVAAAGG